MIQVANLPAVGCQDSLHDSSCQVASRLFVCETVSRIQVAKLPVVVRQDSLEDSSCQVASRAWLE